MPLKSCNYHIGSDGQLRHIFRFANGKWVALNSEQAFEFAMKLMDNGLAKLSQFKKSGLSMPTLSKWAIAAQCA